MVGVSLKTNLLLRGHMGEVKKPFQVGATLEGISSLKDGGVSLRFHTQELTPEEMTIAFSYQQGFGWLLFQEQEYDTTDLDLEQIRKDTGGKSPSQRLRASLYVLYKESNRTDITFEQYYGQKMNGIIDQVKSLLP